MTIRVLFHAEAGKDFLWYLVCNNLNIITQLTTQISFIGIFVGFKALNEAFKVYCDDFWHFHQTEINSHISTQNTQMKLEFQTSAKFCLLSFLHPISRTNCNRFLVCGLHNEYYKYSQEYYKYYRSIFVLFVGRWSYVYY